VYISITQFRAQCLQLIRQLEGGGEPIEIHRRGKVVARLLPASKVEGDAIPAWEQLRGSGELQMEPEESVLQASEFEAAR